MDWFALIVGSLATWRCAELVTTDIGPFRIFQWWRNLWKKKPMIHELFTCNYCASGWLAIGMCVALAATGYSSPLWWPIFWLGIWGGAMAILRAVRERD